MMIPFILVQSEVRAKCSPQITSETPLAGALKKLNCSYFQNGPVCLQEGFSQG